MKRNLSVSTNEQEKSIIFRFKFKQKLIKKSQMLNTHLINKCKSSTKRKNIEFKLKINNKKSLMFEIFHNQVLLS